MQCQLSAEGGVDLCYPKIIGTHTRTDPRPPGLANFKGLGERPRRIGEGVVWAIEQWKRQEPTTRT
jgi:hypothetical protein